MRDTIETLLVSNDIQGPQTTQADFAFSDDVIWEIAKTNVAFF
jgi:hypothetical protein